MTLKSVNPLAHMTLSPNQAADLLKRVETLHSDLDAAGVEGKILMDVKDLEHLLDSIIQPLVKQVGEIPL